jgi:hypothetical protein
MTGTLGSRLVQLKPYDPESKGIVERANHYLETSILPGRSFTSPADFNDQLGNGSRLPTAAGCVLDGRPVDFLDADRAQMLAAGAADRRDETVGAAAA